MLKLTVLQRYSKDGRRVCKTLGIIDFDFKLREKIGEQSTTSFNTKYADKKSIICDLFSSEKSFREIFRELEKNNMRVAEPKLPEDRDKQIAILIED